VSTTQSEAAIVAAIVDEAPPFSPEVSTRLSVLLGRAS